MNGIEVTVFSPEAGLTLEQQEHLAALVYDFIEAGEAVEIIADYTRKTVDVHVEELVRDVTA